MPTISKLQKPPTPWFVGFAVWVVIAVLYVTCLPTTVQELDTGELTTNAWLLAVAHPPGMPVFMWLQYAFMHLIPTGSIFWRASLAASIYALAGLWLLGRSSQQYSLRENATRWFMVIVPLALSNVYWAYAVRPDVFAAHASMCTALLCAYFYMRPSPRRAYVMAIVAAFGLGMHQSIAFLLPLVGHAALQTRSWRVLVHCLLLGCTIVGLEYGSLLLMHPDLPESWGELHGLRDVVRHMLREDYGTWQLDGHDRPPQAAHNFATLFYAFLQDTPVTLGLCVALPVLWVKRRSIDAREALVVGLLVAYCGVFFSLANNPREDILQRFFVMAFVIASALALRALNTLPLSPRWQALLVGCACIVTASHIPENCARHNLSEDTVIEDYARNLLVMAQSPAALRPALLVNGDTRGYALRYVQSVLQVGRDVLILNQGNIFGTSFRRKIAVTHPDFVYAPDWDKGNNARSILKHAIEPNLDRYQFTFDRDVNYNGYRMTYKGLGRTLSQGSGEGADIASTKKILIRSVPSVWSEDGYSERKDFFAEYAFVYLKDAQYATSRRQALDDYECASKLVPYCFPARRALCLAKADGAQACEAEVADLQSRQFNYY